ncbi:MAG: methyltransferase domain-containing protein [Bacteroidales bacterium]
MNTDFLNKSTAEEIRQKFNSMVDSYSDLEAGQKTAVDSVLIARLIAGVVSNLHPHAKDMLDIGCGAGNYSLRIASVLNQVNITLVDLSEKMLERAEERLNRVTSGKIIAIREDIRNLQLPENSFDVIVAGTSLHHLRSDEDWHAVFSNIYQTLKPGGSFWVSDLIKHDNNLVHEVLWENYASFLRQNLGKGTERWVYEQMEKEDTPRSVNYQIDMLKSVGFEYTEILHKNMIFAAFGGIKIK